MYGSRLRDDMSSTTPPTDPPTVDRAGDGSRLRLVLEGEYDGAGVVRAMARARHVAERCEPGFGVVVDVRELSPEGNALAALGEWETFLRMAGAAAVVRVGSGPAVAGADRTAASLEEAEELLGRRD